MGASKRSQLAAKQQLAKVKKQKKDALKRYNDKINNTRRLFRALASMQMLTDKLKQQFPGDIWLQRVENVEFLKRAERLFHIYQVSIRDYMPDQCDELPDIQIVQHHVDNKSRCAFCLEDYEAENIVKQLPCEHIFHSLCLSAWLKSNNSCPLCRQTVKGLEEMRTELEQLHSQARSLVSQLII